MNAVVRTNSSGIWLILVALTVLSWALGTEHGFGGTSHVPASLVILVVSVFKFRLVGLYFMDLRDAPWALRGIFEGYCAFLIVLLSVMYLLG